MSNRLLLSPRHRSILEALLLEHLPGVAVWAYGSRVNGRGHEGSDLDLVLRGPGLQEIPLDQLVDFEDAVRESIIPFLVEARDWARLPERFQREIERRHVILTQCTDLDSTRPGLDAEHSEFCPAMPFDEAFRINPLVSIKRGTPTPFVEMAAVNPRIRTVGPTTVREFRGSGSKFRNGDTLLARITPSLENGKIARYWGGADQEVGHGSTEFIVIRGREGITDSDYAYYVARSDLVRSYAIGQMTGTSGRQRVPVESLAHLDVAIPHLDEQRAIAHILGTLDDKIELNRRMNETLEAIARALFMSWFVDFDPVRAKMEGQDTGLPKHMANLFPSQLVESELGKIPEGWAVKKLKDCMNLTMGQSPPGSTYNDRGEGLPFFQGRSDFGSRYVRKRRFCSTPTRLALPEDTLVSVRAPVGDINMAWEKCCIGRGVAALRHKSGSSSFTYYLAWTMQREIKEYEHNGTVFGAINKGQFENLMIIDPDPNLVATFDSISASLDRQIRMNISESRALIAFRDTLLPQLISGEVRVQVTEKSLGGIQ